MTNIKIYGTKISPSIDGIYHYVYRISNILENKHYYGSRTSQKEPYNDLGKKYYSSSRDKIFIKDQKQSPQNYKYKIIKIFNSKQLALECEIKLHNKFDVKSNENFYNKANQKMSGFDTTGSTNKLLSEYNKIFISVKDPITGWHGKVKRDDPRFLSGDLVGITKGSKNLHLSHLKETVTVRNTDGVFLRVSNKDPRYISGELVPVTKGLIVVKDKSGNIFQVMKNDIRYTSGELVGVMKGVVSEERKNLPNRHIVILIKSFLSNLSRKEKYKLMKSGWYQKSESDLVKIYKLLLDKFQDKSSSIPIDCGEPGGVSS